MGTYYLHRVGESERIITRGDVFLRLQLRGYKDKLQQLLRDSKPDTSNAEAWETVRTAFTSLKTKLAHLMSLCQEINDDEGTHELRGLNTEVVEALWDGQKFVHKLYKIVTNPLYPIKDQNWELLRQIQTEFYELAPLRLDIRMDPVKTLEGNSPMPDDMGSTLSSSEHAMTVTLGLPEVLAWSIDDNKAGSWSQDPLDYDGSMEKHGLHRLGEVLSREGKGSFGRKFFAEQLREIARSTYLDSHPETVDHYRKDKHDALTFLADQVIKLSEARSFREGSEC